MSPPTPDVMTAAPPESLTLIGVLGGAFGAVALMWAGLRFLFWPRIQATIRVEVDGATLPLRREMEKGVERIAGALEQVAREVAEHGKVQAATGAAVDILLGDRRSGLDRRHHGAP